MRCFHLEQSANGLLGGKANLTPSVIY